MGWPDMPVSAVDLQPGADGRRDGHSDAGNDAGNDASADAGSDLPNWVNDMGGLPLAPDMP
jgi:hypothetical protein